jgi:hypothetical protein
METNIYPVKIEFNNYQIVRTQYSEDKLKELRTEYNHTHSFFRNGDFIYISNKEGDDSIVLGETVELSTIDDKEVTLSLIKHLFFRTFKDRFPEITPISFYPFRIFSTQQKDDLVREMLPENLQDVLSYKKQIEVQLRTFENNEGLFFGFVIQTNRRWLLNKSCLELHNEGFDLLNREVLLSETLPEIDSVLAPNEEFIGVMSTIEGGEGIVQTNDGEQRFNLNELLIRKTKHNIQEYLDYTIGEEKCEQIFNHIGRKSVEFLDPKFERKEVSLIAKLLSIDHKTNVPIVYLNKDSFCFTINDKPYSPENSYNLGTPTFVFDPAGNRTEASIPDRGLNNFGPYDSLTFDIKSPKVMAICAKENRGSFSTFIANLVDGLPSSSWYKKGLKKKYDLDEMNVDIHEVSSYEYSQYSKIVSAITEQKPDLAIIEIPKEFRNLPDNENPYFKLKARLLSLEIPVQFVLDWKVKKHDEYLLNSIALQIYAKLGGTPWVLASNRSIDREIVIGIGHSLIRSNTFSGAKQNRVVGISTFFSSDGQYLLSNKAKDVSYDEYFNELLRNLKESFDSLEMQQGWKEGDTVRLIFHIFKPIKNLEFEVVSELIQQYSKFKIQFAFVTISKKHPFMMFDQTQPGIKKSYYSNELKGEFVPDRGKNIVLDGSSCLVQMLGAKEIKSDRHGASNPILIRIRRPQGNYNSSPIDDLLFTDLHYITQQIFSFTYLSWRGFLPGEYPATMLYSNLISRLLGKLRNIEGWQPEVLNFNLKRKKWFL